MEKWFIHVYFDASASQYIDLGKIATANNSNNSKIHLIRPYQVGTKNVKDQIMSALGCPLKTNKNDDFSDKEKEYYVQWRIFGVRAPTAPDAVIKYAESVSPTKSKSSVYSGPNDTLKNGGLTLIRNATVFHVGATDILQEEVLLAKDFDFDAI